ncbi:hypothetical protein HK405_011900, partial [Cladochytrium tenue]
MLQQATNTAATHPRTMVVELLYDIVPHPANKSNASKATSKSTSSGPTNNNSKNSTAISKTTTGTLNRRPTNSAPVAVESNPKRDPPLKKSLCGPWPTWVLNQPSLPADLRSHRAERGRAAAAAAATAPPRDSAALDPLLTIEVPPVPRVARAAATAGIHASVPPSAQRPACTDTGPQDGRWRPPAEHLRRPMDVPRADASKGGWDMAGARPIAPSEYGFSQPAAAWQTHGGRSASLARGWRNDPTTYVVYEPFDVLKPGPRPAEDALDHHTDNDETVAADATGPVCTLSHYSASGAALGTPRRIDDLAAELVDVAALLRTHAARVDSARLHAVTRPQTDATAAAVAATATVMAPLLFAQSESGEPAPPAQSGGAKDQRAARIKAWVDGDEDREGGEAGWVRPVE